jgi:hypothetical protein
MVGTGYGNALTHLGNGWLIRQKTSPNHQWHWLDHLLSYVQQENGRLVLGKVVYSKLVQGGAPQPLLAPSVCPGSLCVLQGLWLECDAGMRQSTCPDNELQRSSTGQTQCLVCGHPSQSLLHQATLHRRVQLPTRGWTYGQVSSLEPTNTYPTTKLHV